MEGHVVGETTVGVGTEDVDVDLGSGGGGGGMGSGVGEVITGGGGMMSTGSGGIRVGPGVVMVSDGEIFTRQRRAPPFSRAPRMIGVPAGSLMIRWLASKWAVQPESHSWPRLSRLLVKVGMMWPTLACVVGKVGRARRADAEEVCDSPAAVRIVVGGAVVSRWVTGADGMK